QALRVPLAAAQRLLHTSAVHSIVVMLDKTEDTDRVRRRLEALFRDKGLDLEIKPWYEMADFYTKAEVFLDRQFLILKVIIAGVLVLSVLNTRNVSVTGRMGEIGTVMALGYKRSGVVRLFMAGGLVLGLRGAVRGLAAAFAAARLISWVGIPLPPPP